jgi:predicted component of type VI protein secretion system
VKRYKDKIPEERQREIVLAHQRETKEAEDAELNEDQVEISTSMKTVLREIEKILNKVKEEDDHVLSLTALRDMRATLMDLGKIYGQLNDKTTIQVSINEAPEWVRLRLILGDVFRDHPAAGSTFLERVNLERLSIAGRPV